jgi:VIT1/CCC1 family predicted Fe2+/Mn2+ transporter
MNAVSKVTPIKAGKQLSMSKSAVASRARRLALKQAPAPAPAPAKKPAKAPTRAPKPRKLPTAGVRVSAAQKRTLNQSCAALAAGFLPIASFVIAHYESRSNPILWLLVGAALLFSAPTLATWASKWCGSQYKAWGFTALLEGVMVFSHLPVLSFAGLAILVLINASNAWTLSAQRTSQLA